MFQSLRHIVNHCVFNSISGEESAVDSDRWIVTLTTVLQHNVIEIVVHFCLWQTEKTWIHVAKSMLLIEKCWVLFQLWCPNSVFFFWRLTKKNAFSAFGCCFLYSCYIPPFFWSLFPGVKISVTDEEAAQEGNSGNVGKWCTSTEEPVRASYYAVVIVQRHWSNLNCRFAFASSEKIFTFPRLPAKSQGILGQVRDILKASSMSAKSQEILFLPYY